MVIGICLADFFFKNYSTANRNLLKCTVKKQQKTLTRPNIKNGMIDMYFILILLYVKKSLLLLVLLLVKEMF